MIPRRPCTSSVSKILPLTFETPTSPILVSSLEEEQEEEEVQEMSACPMPIEIQDEIDQPYIYRPRKATIIQNLKENIKEYIVLDIHFKQENTRLKECFYELDQKVIKLKGEKIFLLKMAWKWYQETQKLFRRNKVLNIKLLQENHWQQQTTFISHLDLLSQVAKEA